MRFIFFWTVILILAHKKEQRPPVAMPWQGLGVLAAKSLLQQLLHAFLVTCLRRSLGQWWHCDTTDLRVPTLRATSTPPRLQPCPSSVLPSDPRGDLQAPKKSELCLWVTPKCGHLLLGTVCAPGFSAGGPWSLINQVTIPLGTECAFWGPLGDLGVGPAWLVGTTCGTTGSVGQVCVTTVL